MYLGGSGISCPVPLSWMKLRMSFSTSQPSRESLIFSHDLIGLDAVNHVFGTTHSIIADTNSRCNVCESPQATFHKIESLLLEILEFLSPQLARLSFPPARSLPHIASSLPISIPSTSRLFQRFDGRLIFVACSRELNLGLLHLGLVFALFLAHHHVPLC